MRPLVLWAAVLALALLGWAAWWTEIALVHGWTGRTWIHVFPISAVFGAWMAGLCAVLPLLDARRPRLDRQRVVRTAMALAVVFGVAFGMGREGLIELIGDTGVALIGMTDPDAAREILLRRIGTLFAVVIGAAGVAWVLLLRLSPALRWWTAPLLAGAFGAALPVGWLLAQILPELGGRPDIVQTVKLGTPVFAVCVLTAAAVRGGLRSLVSEPGSRESPRP